MFEQHPVPQQISSYSFKLVGDMTLKQFFQLAGGAVIALIIYSFPLPAVIRWPLVLVSALGGAAFAFLPVQDRPLEQWLAAFFRSIYSPTVFLWKRPQQPIQYFQPEAKTGEEQIDDVSMDTTDPEYVKKLDKGEKDYLHRITGLLSGKGFGAQKPEATVVPPLPTPALPVEPVVKQDVVVRPVVQAPPVSTTPAPTTPQPQEVAVPQEQRVELEHKGFEMPAEQAETRKVETSQVGQVLSGSQTPAQPAQAAQFSSEAAPPTPPEYPNILVGQVMDITGKIIEGAILEIKDSGGRPVRALKTNRAGHFMIVTPLANGEYQIFTEKDGLEFDPVSVQPTGEIISPIAIKSKNQMIVNTTP